MSGFFSQGAKAAAWPHRLEQLEKKLSGFVEKQTQTNGELIQQIHELRVDLTKMEGAIRETVSEAGKAAVGTAAHMTSQIHSEVAAMRERLAVMETKLSLGVRPAPNGQDQLQLGASS